MVQEETRLAPDTGLMTKNVWNIDRKNWEAILAALEEQFNSRMGLSSEEVDLYINTLAGTWTKTAIAYSKVMLKGWNSYPWNSFYDYLILIGETQQAEKLVKISYFHGVTLDVVRKSVEKYLMALLRAVEYDQNTNRRVLIDTAHDYANLVDERMSTWEEIALRELELLSVIKHKMFWEEIRLRCAAVQSRTLSNLYRDVFAMTMGRGN